MKNYHLWIALALSLVGNLRSVQADGWLLRTQYSNPADVLVGTWQSGNFAYSFQSNWTYVYVGAMGAGSGMQTRISEQGTYGISGGTLFVNRQNGVITTTQNYRQELKPETTTFPFALLNTQTGLAMRLTFQNGTDQLFYKISP